MSCPRSQGPHTLQRSCLLATLPLRCNTFSTNFLIITSKGCIVYHVFVPHNQGWFRFWEHFFFKQKTGTQHFCLLSMNQIVIERFCHLTSSAKLFRNLDCRGPSECAKRSIVKRSWKLSCLAHRRLYQMFDISSLSHLAVKIWFGLKCFWHFAQLF